MPAQRAYAAISYETYMTGGPPTLTSPLRVHTSTAFLVDLTEMNATPATYMTISPDTYMT